MERQASQRIAYCKNGDVVHELQVLGPNPRTVPDGGPFHYIATLLAWSGDSPMLLLSSHAVPRTMRYEDDRASATVIAARRPIAGPLGAAISQLRLFLGVLLPLLRFRPSLVVCATTGPALWACFLAARLFGAPLVHSRHNRVEIKGGGALRRAQYRLSNWMIRQAAAVLCHGPYIRQQLLEAGVDARRLLEFNLSYRHLLRAAENVPALAGLGIGPDARVVLYVGRITQAKGVFDLLEAMRDCLADDEELTLVYAGDGKDLERLRAAAARLAPGRVLVLGQVDFAAIPPLMKRAAVVVVPTRSSLGEGRCKTAIEALVVGRPVIAPAEGLFPYMIEHGLNGLMYAPDSVTDLSAQLRRALTEPELYRRLTTEGAEASRRRLMESDMTFEEALSAAQAMLTRGQPAKAG